MDGYTVVDVETTGLSPTAHDRIVELGVVYVSNQGVVQDRWSTLINPQRDVGPTRVHGISATDVAGAPTFAEVAPYLLRAIAGRVVVAHNASFDLRFVAHELIRAGVPLTDLPLMGVCTMQWSSHYVSGSSRRLIDCCRASGISLENAHSASADAFAAAQLLSFYLEAARFRPMWHDTIDRSKSYKWPSYRGTYSEMRLAHRSEAHAPRPVQWLDGVMARMPRAADPKVDAYLGVLEEALLDGFLSEAEKAALVSVAVESGLSRGQVLDIHVGYLRALAAVALADNVVTSRERADLELVARLLGLPSSDVDTALHDASQGLSVEPPATEVLATAGIDISAGDCVAFTGDLAIERTKWESRARARGLQPGGVTKTTKVLVASDPNTVGGKAAKARSYGIPIITEAAFERLLEHLALQHA